MGDFVNIYLDSVCTRNVEYINKCYIFILFKFIIKLPTNYMPTNNSTTPSLYKLQIIWNQESIFIQFCQQYIFIIPFKLYLFSSPGVIFRNINNGVSLKISTLLKYSFCFLLLTTCCNLKLYAYVHHCQFNWLSYSILYSSQINAIHGHHNSVTFYKHTITNTVYLHSQEIRVGRVKWPTSLKNSLWTHVWKYICKIQITIIWLLKL